MATDDVCINGQVTIPAAELSFTFTTSGGPGGQHANKTATAVHLRFNIPASPSLTVTQKTRLRQELGGRINTEGELFLTARDERSQHRNKGVVIDRFVRLLAAALKPRTKRRRTRPTQGSRQRRLTNKRQQSEKKTRRQPPPAP